MSNEYREKIKERMGDPEDYPITGKTEEGITVDRSIVEYIERIRDLGLQTKASCSGMRRDHEGNPSPYLSIQAAESGWFPQAVTRWPDSLEVTELAKRLEKVGEKTGWGGYKGLYLLSWPTVTFRVAPTRGNLKNIMYPNKEWDDLTEQEEDALDEELSRLNEQYKSVSDKELDERWEELTVALEQEFKGNPPSERFED